VHRLARLALAFRRPIVATRSLQNSAICSSACARSDDRRHEVRRYYANFTYQAAVWTKPPRVIAKVEWLPGELYPRVGFIITIPLARVAAPAVGLR
jgi:hypothetical protein